jgi:hypothetical protein
MHWRGFPIVLGMVALAASSAAQTPPTTITTATVPPAWPSQQPPAPEVLNQTFGIPLFGDTSLWNEDEKVVDKRLDLKKESRTDEESSFQDFNKDGNAEILGVRYFLASTQGTLGKISGITILFANKSDAPAFATDLEREMKKTSPHLPKVSMQMLAAMQAAIRDDNNQINQTLDGILGPGSTASLKTISGRERGTRWDWRGHTFFLVMVPNEYITLKIFPSTDFDNTDAERITFSKITQSLPSQVQHLPNGDVIIPDIPMIDEGSDGTMSAPTSMIRLLRYYGLEGDLNALSATAVAANLKASNNFASLTNILPTINSQLNAVGARIVYVQGGNIPLIKPYIDRGQPVLWSVYGDGKFKSLLKERATERDSVVDWTDWKNNGLSQARASAQTLPSRGKAHTCLIIGYNENTGEIAISNAWGSSYNVGWLTQQEAHYINQGYGAAIVW